ncbi:uncharacterized protein AMSG_01240 [Thecamonas trahens ATCC 50062]|uniref:Uncharacterized protein n=1 Tax=Thecamonas trahens ATCC 50062 TaxID=461836 RepID=A0A0L0DMI4_THETB|nr:hypothetical protein AMSG_01240 [Thecamonas trahens ATCC 50062]KNC53527.1 hypothetical protein AMSG_01240 [Thecamonas trahens ATCC 50062]|eukprot:XP_013761848.1 hypothetical protein AMSG_01240 [Thecamonas trahens ATCC 50062]
MLLSQFGAFFRRTNLAVSSILAKPEFTLEELLDEESLVDEVRQQDGELVNFLKLPSTLRALLTYALVPNPAADASGDAATASAPSAVQVAEESTDAAATTADDGDADPTTADAEPQASPNSPAAAASYAKYARVSGAVLATAGWPVYEAFTEDHLQLLFSALPEIVAGALDERFPAPADDAAAATPDDAPAAADDGPDALADGPDALADDGAADGDAAAAAAASSAAADALASPTSDSMDSMSESDAADEAADENARVRADRFGAVFNLVMQNCASAAFAAMKAQPAVYAHRHGELGWLAEQNLVGKIVAKFDAKAEPETQAVVTATFMSLIDTVESLEIAASSIGASLTAPQTLSALVTYASTPETLASGFDALLRVLALAADAQVKKHMARGGGGDDVGVVGAHGYPFPPGVFASLAAASAPPMDDMAGAMGGMVDSPVPVEKKLGTQWKTLRAASALGEIEELVAMAVPLVPLLVEDIRRATSTSEPLETAYSATLPRRVTLEAMHRISVLVTLVQINSPAIDQALVDLDVVSLLLDLFVASPSNNVLHTAVTNFVLGILRKYPGSFALPASATHAVDVGRSGATVADATATLAAAEAYSDAAVPAVVAALHAALGPDGADLPGKLLAKSAENAEAVASPKGFRLPSMGHVCILGNALNASPFFGPLLADSGPWAAFVSAELSTFNELNTKPMGAELTGPLASDPRYHMGGSDGSGGPGDLGGNAGNAGSGGGSGEMLTSIEDLQNILSQLLGPGADQALAGFGQGSATFDDDDDDIAFGAAVDDDDGEYDDGNPFADGDFQFGQVSIPDEFDPAEAVADSASTGIVIQDGVSLSDEDEVPSSEHDNFVDDDADAAALLEADDDVSDDDDNATPAADADAAPAANASAEDAVADGEASQA